MPTAPMIALGPSWADFLDRAATRSALENDWLAAYLAGERWFRGKARRIAGVRLIDWANFGGGLYLALAEVRYGDGDAETYALPLQATLEEPAARRAGRIPEGRVAPIRTAQGEGALIDALYDPTACVRILQTILQGREIPTAREGRVRAFATAAGATAAGRRDGQPAARIAKMERLAAEQSNTSVILDDAFVLKIFRKVEDGPHPDLEIGLYLTEQTDFRHSAPVWGGMFYDRGGATSTLAMLQPFIENDGDGWTYTLRELARVFAHPHVRGHGAPPPEPASPRAGAREMEPRIWREMAGDYLDSALLLGRRTGEFHLALARGRGQVDFAPESMTGADLEALAGRIVDRAREALLLLEKRRAALPPDARIPADRVLAAGLAPLQLFHRLGAGAIETPRIRCHGDYHLGQVLRVGGDFVLLDFEGEPLRPLAERRQKCSPLKDVAGMLRSFSYAFQAGLQEAGAAEPALPAADLPHVRAWGRSWQAWVSAAFLRGYLQIASSGELLPRDPVHCDALLDAFLFDKAFYELVYELNHRPDWVRLPLEGILDRAGHAGG
ncbi:MAG: putative maltokinase [Candidatus Eisenbacteria bacterium]